MPCISVQLYTIISASLGYEVTKLRMVTRTCFSFTYFTKVTRFLMIFFTTSKHTPRIHTYSSSLMHAQESPQHSTHICTFLVFIPFIQFEVGGLHAIKAKPVKINCPEVNLSQPRHAVYKH
ncbi:hypothetical protein VTL71DRAFT_1457 [Oculimacula yallundae]|uniref:Uncharacterized protein n=1 Tax=Oculimacula yallundae TaxID=86028 RepID=A0ABR4CAQ6_9HELO